MRYEGSFYTQFFWGAFFTFSEKSSHPVLSFKKTQWFQAQITSMVNYWISKHAKILILRDFWVRCLWRNMNLTVCSPCNVSRCWILLLSICNVCSRGKMLDNWFGRLSNLLWDTINCSSFLYLKYKFYTEIVHWNYTLTIIDVTVTWILK